MGEGVDAVVPDRSAFGMMGGMMGGREEVSGLNGSERPTMRYARSITAVKERRKITLVFGGQSCVRCIKPEDVLIPSLWRVRDVVSRRDAAEIGAH